MPRKSAQKIFTVRLFMHRTPSLTKIGYLKPKSTSSKIFIKISCYLLTL